MCFIPGVPGAALSGDVGHFIWPPGRSFTLAARDRLSVWNVAGPRQKGENTARHSSVSTEDGLPLPEQIPVLVKCMQLYTALGLESSVRKVLNFRNMLLCAEYVIDNMEFPRGLPLEDMFQVMNCTFLYRNVLFWGSLIFCLFSLQLGGDFLLDEHGRVLFSHRCRSPIDRPSARDILSALSATVD